MPRPILSVIGGLSIETIHLLHELPEAGQMVRADEFTETGGRAANIAIAASRSTRPKPPTDDGLLPITPHEYGGGGGGSSSSGYHPSGSADDRYNSNTYNSSEQDSIPEVRVIAAVTPSLQPEFTSLFRRNGVETSGLTPFSPGQQSKIFSIVQRDTRRARSTFISGVEQLWKPSDFSTPEKLGNGVRPDLVVVTMELKKEVVEEIIRTAYHADIEVIVYGSPAASLLNECYPMISHIILNEGDACVFMGEGRGHVNIDNWSQICEYFHGDLQVANVVLKLGFYGAYYKNEHDEGFASGYTKMLDVEDATGST